MTKMVQVTRKLVNMPKMVQVTRKLVSMPKMVQVTRKLVLAIASDLGLAPACCILKLIFQQEGFEV